ncbi:MAG: hypothetical protein KF824_02785 [Fimbriimonadaceae bacterium]|nr:MAG: hypothetical protein KF824_02785 [Fimbriimonadaceae bacterium]
MNSAAEILQVIFGGLIIITWISLHYGRKIAESLAKKNEATNPQEIQALRQEVAGLRQAVGDLMWQLESQKGTQGIEPQVQDRLTPPEFNKH